LSAKKSNVHRLYYQVLLPKQKADQRTQFPAVIENLEMLLERAKAGKVSSIAYACIDTESGRIDYQANGLATVAGGSSSSFALIGALVRLQNQIERKCDELDYEED